jgi:hypothetical protein
MAFPVSYAASIEELHDGMAEGCNEQGPWGRRVYLMPWANRWDFVGYLKGSSSTTGATAPWVRVRPAPYPVAMAGGQIYATDVQIAGEGSPILGSDPLAWDKAKLTVTWGPLALASQASVDDPFFLNSFSDEPLIDGTTQSLDYSAEYVQIPTGSAGFTDGLKIDTPFNKRVLITHLNIEWNRFPRLPLSAVRTYSDSVNSAKFLGGERGTVMFGGVKTKRTLDTDGKVTQTVSMSLKWRKNDWNEFIRPDDGTFDAVIYNGDGSSSTYPYKDFRVLLQL